MLHTYDAEEIDRQGVLTAGQTLNEITAHTEVALRVGVAPIDIKESLYQCAPYIGFPRTLNALGCVNAVLQDS